MKYYDKLIFELSKEGRTGYSLPNVCFAAPGTNSASLRFIPYDEMDEQGYGEYKQLFDP